MNNGVLRRFFIYLFVLIVLIFLIGRLLFIMTSSNWIPEFTKNRHRSFLQQEGVRGLFLDRLSNPIALNVRRYQLVVDPYVVSKNTQLIQTFSKLLNVPFDRVKQKIDYAVSPRYLVLKKNINYEEYQNHKEQLSAFRSSGIFWKHHEKRFYPYGEIMGNFLGFNDYQNNGQEGLERYLNDELVAQKKQYPILVDSRRVAFEHRLELKYNQGEDIQLYLDTDLQFALYDALKRAFQDYQAVSASAVVVDYKKGTLLAIANQPSFNPNDRKTFTPDRYKNRAILDVFEPGSSIKPIVLAIALEEGVVQPTETLDVTSPWLLGNAVIKDFKNYGTLNLKNILKKSSNVGVAKIASKLNPINFWEKLAMFGFNRSCIDESFYQSYGSFRSYKNWYGTDQAVLGYGYGVSVNLMQLVCAYMTLINDGVYKSVKIIKRQTPSNESLKNKTVVSTRVANTVKQWLIANVQESGGTSMKAQIKHYTAGGKTGTVQIQDPKTGKYANNQHRSIFVGFLEDAQHPYLMAVMINKPQKQYYASQVAAGIFSEVFTNFLKFKKSYLQ